MTFSLETIVQILSIVFGVGGIGSFFLSARRTQAQNDLDISTAWEKFSAPLLQRIEHLEKVTAEQENTIADLRGWAQRLVKQIIELGGEPVTFITRRPHRPTPPATTEYPRSQE